MHPTLPCPPPGKGHTAVQRLRWSHAAAAGAGVHALLQELPLSSHVMVAHLKVAQHGCSSLGGGAHKAVQVGEASGGHTQGSKCACTANKVMSVWPVS